MRTPFSRTHRTRNALLGPGSSILAISLGAILVILILIRFIFPGAFTALVSPLWGAGEVGSRATGGFFSVFADRAELTSARDMLAAENAALTGQNAVLQARVDDLTRLLGDRAEPAKGTLASVRARPPVAPYDTLVIDRGASAGIEVGSQVQGPGGVPVGTIESVENDSARVSLYSAPSRITEGWVGEARLPLSLEGVGSGSFKASVPREASTTIASLVYVPGNGSLPIGSIARVDSDPSSPRSVVHVKPLVSPFSLTWVVVMPL